VRAPFGDYILEKNKLYKVCLRKSLPRGVTLVSKEFHKSIRSIVIALLIIGVIINTLQSNQFNIFNYAIVVALIFIVWRTPLAYTK
jgi:cytochrome b561